MRVYIDTCGVEDFDKVVRHLFDRGVDVSNRDKMLGEIRVEISAEMIEELKELDLINTISIGTRPLIEPKYSLDS